MTSEMLGGDVTSTRRIDPMLLQSVGEIRAGIIGAVEEIKNLRVGVGDVKQEVSDVKRDMAVITERYENLCRQLNPHSTPCAVLQQVEITCGRVEADLREFKLWTHGKVDEFRKQKENAYLYILTKLLPWSVAGFLAAWQVKGMLGV